MQKRLGSVMGIGRRIGLSDEKGVVVAVFVALIILGCTVAGYYIFLKPPAEEYNTIYLLDSQKQASNYPQVLVANQNSTFSVYVNVENHMNTRQTYEVRTKIVNKLLLTPEGVDATPVNSYDVTVASGASSQNSVTITENTVGNYQVVFELWRQDTNGNYTFTYDYCVLNVKVVK